MLVDKICKKYGLDKEADCWPHKPSRKWILTHDAIEKIATIENITLTEIKVLNTERDFARFLITMERQWDVVNSDGNTDTNYKQISSIGEADKSNCTSKYYGCMAEKRGIDRCVLKLIEAYEYGISSEVEADDFKKDEKPMSSYQGTRIVEILKYKEGYDKKVVKSIFSNLSHTEAQDIISHFETGRIDEAVESFYNLNKGDK